MEQTLARPGGIMRVGLVGVGGGIAACVATLLSGCNATDAFMTSVRMPATSTSTAVAQGAPLQRPPSGAEQPPESDLLVTPQQRGYLDALTAGGVHPSSELMALSIGSYICQARAAGQNNQAVWDFVHPLVHSDVRNAHLSATAPTDAEVDAATQSYIRIAVERLC